MNNFHGLGFHKANLLRSSEHRQTWPSDMELAVAQGLLSQIPPERVGLNGEYDHSGLAKRVQLALQQKFDATIVAQLEIAQRGKVVIISGKSLDDLQVRQMTKIALEIDGADFVEIFGTAPALQQVA
ncbi:hypothetical protein [Romeriopsis navalis]|uniref:hypothetical protein n=1 Tax=Romeriopsis navalis TaxID=2992132 RepID=UPI0021F8AA6B|nr:hypothetical protein [Romeriopsis navalis]